MDTSPFHWYPTAAQKGEQQGLFSRKDTKYCRKISHKNICRLHNFQEEKELPLITMQGCEGQAEVEDAKKRLAKLQKILP